MTDPWEKLISGDEIFDLHRIGLERYGGRKPAI